MPFISAHDERVHTAIAIIARWRSLDFAMIFAQFLSPQKVNIRKAGLAYFSLDAFFICCAAKYAFGARRWRTLRMHYSPGYMPAGAYRHFRQGSKFLDATRAFDCGISLARPTSALYAACPAATTPPRRAAATAGRHEMHARRRQPTIPASFKGAQGRAHSYLEARKPPRQRNARLAKHYFAQSFTSPTRYRFRPRRLHAILTQSMGAMADFLAISPHEDAADVGAMAATPALILFLPP